MTRTAIPQGPCDICGKYRSAANHTECSKQRQRFYQARNKERQRA